MFRSKIIRPHVDAYRCSIQCVGDDVSVPRWLDAHGASMVHQCFFAIRSVIVQWYTNGGFRVLLESSLSLRRTLVCVLV